MATHQLPTRSHADPAVLELIARRADFLPFLQRRIGAAEAEDILHGVYARLLERGVSLRDHQALESWFYRVLRNAVVDHVRSSSRRARLSRDLELAPAPTHAQDNNAGDCASVVKRASELIAALPERHREALTVVYLHDGSLRDLATRTGVTTNTAAVRLHRARAALRSLMHAADIALPLPCAA